MRKLISLFLVLAMILSLSVTAFAAETEDRAATANEASDYKASIDVNGKYISRLDSDEIISVDVAWQDMNFIYYGSQEGTWNPTTHTYDGEKTAKWNKTTSNITVTNHSNAEVTANLSYTQSVTSVTGTMSPSSLTLESAAQEAYMGDNANQAPAGTSTFTIDGTMDSSSATALGTITVSLAKGSSTDGEDDNSNTDNGTEWKVVNTYAELETELSKGGNMLIAEESFNLDLNGKELKAYRFKVGSVIVNNIDAIISNGTLTTNDHAMSAIIYNRADNLTIENCTLNGVNYWALYINGGNVSVNNTILNGGVAIQSDSATFTAGENVEVTYAEGYKYQSGVAVTEGSTATFRFNPTEFLTANYNEGSLTDNGDGTWTVS